MNRKLTIGLHILIWILLIIQDVNLQMQYNMDVFVASLGLPTWLYFGCISTAYHINGAILFYGIVLVICPLLFDKKKYLWGTISFVTLAVCIVVFRYLIEFHVLKPYLKFDNYFGKPVSVTWYIKNCLLYHLKTGHYLIYGIIYFFITNWFKREKEKREIINQKVSAELAFLRYQVNPHFLFNAINDIYALSVKNRKETSPALLHLSAMLRYLLNDNKKSMVPLDVEIAYMKDYIELQKISYQNKICVNFKCDGRLSGWKIPKLLLVPFLENAFKHGETDSFEHPVVIHIRADEANLSFICSNRIKPMLKDKTSGVGLNNIKRRLALIYPGQHELFISEKTGNFNVILHINNKL